MPNPLTAILMKHPNVEHLVIDQIGLQCNPATVYEIGLAIAANGIKRVALASKAWSAFTANNGSARLQPTPLPLILAPYPNIRGIGLGIDPDDGVEELLKDAFDKGWSVGMDKIRQQRRGVLDAMMRENKVTGARLADHPRQSAADTVSDPAWVAAGLQTCTLEDAQAGSDAICNLCTALDSRVINEQDDCAAQVLPMSQSCAHILGCAHQAISAAVALNL